MTRERKKIIIGRMESAKKEILAAIIIGLLVGAIATIYSTGIWKNILFLFKPRQREVAKIATPMPQSPTKTENLTYFMDFNTPADEKVSSSKFEISGKTIPITKILISSEKEDIIIESSREGLFKKSIDLYPGTNTINVLLFTTDEKLSKELKIYYFPADY